jgi:hypothetical protein
MAVNPPLNDGESFVPGRSEAKARELIEAAEAAGLDASEVVTTSHGYIVPSKIAPEGSKTGADRPAVPTEPGTTTDPKKATNVGGLSQDADEQTRRANEDAERQASPEGDEPTPEEATVQPDDEAQLDVRTANQARREANEGDNARREAEATRRETPDPDATPTPRAEVEDGDDEADSEQFDPGDHTVDEVWDYLENANDQERQRVLDAEKAGKNRKAFQSETEGDK